MDIIVCVKRVPDLSEVEVEIDVSNRRIKTDDLAFGINEWDKFAVEEAVRLREDHGGTVTALTVGDEDSEDVLRRALAMGADGAVRLTDQTFEGADAYVTARVLHAAIASMPFDLILTGSVSSDSGAGLVGGMLSEMLGIPQVALATSISMEGGKMLVQHEVEGGMERVVEVELPALVTVQTGINEPRYVSIRGIRRVAGIGITVKTAADLDLDSDQTGEMAKWVEIDEMFLPPEGVSAEILDGSPEDIVEQLIDRLKQHGGL